MVPDVWGTLLGRGLRFLLGSRIRNSMKKRDPFVHGQMESLNNRPQAIELNPSCLRPAQSNKLGTDYAYESTEPEYNLTVLRVSSVICILRSADA